MRTVNCLFMAAFLLAVSAARAVDRGIKVREVLGTDAQVPRYHALVIGINNYVHWQDLRQARDDARELAKLLKSRYGFEDIKTLYDKDASLSAMIRALRHYTRTLTPRDALLIYYAGHGYYDPLLKKGYWVPAEGREQIGNEPAINDWLHNTTLKEFVDAMKARHVLVVSDSCFSGSMMRGGRVDLNAKEYTWYRRALSQPCRWCIASGDLETVPDQSVFASKFIQALQYPRQPVFAASDLAGWIKSEVAASTGRHPVFGPMNSVGHSDIGEFVFLAQSGIGGGSAPAVEPPTSEPATIPRVSGPDLVSPVPAPVVTYGTLVVESPLNASIRVDDTKAFPVSAGKALRWDRIATGPHKISVRSGSMLWEQSVRVAEGATTTVKAFPHEAKRLEDAARERAAELEAERLRAERAAAELERERLKKETAELLKRLEEEKKKEEEKEKRRYRPRAH